MWAISSGTGVQRFPLMIKRVFLRVLMINLILNATLEMQLDWTLKRCMYFGICMAFMV